jgi:hypothetical protein
MTNPFRNVLVTDDLQLALTGVVVQLSPREGLQLAEDLTRKAFRRVLADEAARVPPVTPRRRAGKAVR